MWPAFFVLCYRCFCAFCAISLVGPYETTLFINSEKESNFSSLPHLFKPTLL